MDERELERHDHGRIIVNFSGNPIEKGGLFTSRLFKEEEFKEYMFGTESEFDCLTMKGVRQVFENCQRSTEEEIRKEVDSIPSFASLGARHLLMTAQLHYQHQKTNQEIRVLLEMMQESVYNICWRTSIGNTFSCGY